VMVGTMSIGSDTGTAVAETLFDDETAEESMGIDFGREAGERWSVGKGLRGKDSVVVAIMERGRVAKLMLGRSLVKFGPVRSRHTKAGGGEGRRRGCARQKYRAVDYFVISMNVIGWGLRIDGRSKECSLAIWGIRGIGCAGAPSI
jgi:hypothetical protein